MNTIDGPLVSSGADSLIEKPCKRIAGFVDRSLLHQKGRVGNDLLPLSSGLVCVVLLCIALIAAGGRVLVSAHDQLDGELIVYMLHAAHPFDTWYPELLGGLSAGNLIMASPGSILFFLLLDARAAFIANWCFVMLMAYLGMYVCLRRFSVSRGICLCVSVLFACIPFYSVYGLTAMGVPLAVLAARLAACRRMGLACLLVVLYGSFSSPFLCGFAVITGYVAYVLVLLVVHRKGEALRVAAVAAFLVVVYVAFNWYALAPLFSGIDTQRAEFALLPAPFSWEDVFALYFDGRNASGDAVFYHAESNQHYISRISLVSTFTCTAALVIERLRGATPPESLRRLVRFAAVLQFTVFAVVVFYCAFRSPAAIGLREMLPGALRTFQADRFHWLLPSAWYLCIGVTAEALMVVADGHWWLRLVASSAVALALTSTLSADLLTNDAFATAKAELGGECTQPGQVSWDSFFAEDAFAAIKREIDGEVDSYRIACIGLHPSVAVFNGLRTVDGYSNNYPLTYKHRFRYAIADELELNEDLRAYFDDWGNRCYVFQHEVGRNFSVDKNSGIVIRDLRVDLRALYDLGCRYLLSAAPIVSCESYGLIDKGAYDTASSIYRIHVYELFDGRA